MILKKKHIIIILLILVAIVIYLIYKNTKKEHFANIYDSFKDMELTYKGIGANEFLRRDDYSYEIIHLNTQTELVLPVDRKNKKANVIAFTSLFSSLEEDNNNSKNDLDIINNNDKGWVAYEDTGKTSEPFNKITFIKKDTVSYLDINTKEKETYGFDKTSLRYEIMNRENIYNSFLKSSYEQDIFDDFIKIKLKLPNEDLVYFFEKSMRDKVDIFKQEYFTDLIPSDIKDVEVEVEIDFKVPDAKFTITDIKAYSNSVIAIDANTFYKITSVDTVNLRITEWNFESGESKKDILTIEDIKDTEIIYKKDQLVNIKLKNIILNYDGKITLEDLIKKVKGNLFLLISDKSGNGKLFEIYLYIYTDNKDISPVPSDSETQENYLNVKYVNINQIDNNSKGIDLGGTVQHLITGSNITLKFNYSNIENITYSPWNTTYRKVNKLDSYGLKINNINLKNKIEDDQFKYKIRYTCSLNSKTNENIKKIFSTDKDVSIDSGKNKIIITLKGTGLKINNIEAKKNEIIKSLSLENNEWDIVVINVQDGFTGSYNIENFSSNKSTYKITLTRTCEGDTCPQPSPGEEEDDSKDDSDPSPEPSPEPSTCPVDSPCPSSEQFKGEYNIEHFNSNNRTDIKVLNFIYDNSTFESEPQKDFKIMNNIYDIYDIEYHTIKDISNLGIKKNSFEDLKDTDIQEIYLYKDDKECAIGFIDSIGKEKKIPNVKCLGLPNNYTGLFDCEVHSDENEIFIGNKEEIKQIKKNGNNFDCDENGKCSTFTGEYLLENFASSFNKNNDSSKKGPGPSDDESKNEPGPSDDESKNEPGPSDDSSAQNNNAKEPGPSDDSITQNNNAKEPGPSDDSSVDSSAQKNNAKEPGPSDSVESTSNSSSGNSVTGTSNSSTTNSATGTSNSSSGNSVTGTSNSSTTNQGPIDSNLMNISETLNSLLALFKQISQDGIKTQGDHEKFQKQLALIQSMAEFYEQAMGVDDENVKFIKQLLVLTLKKMDLLVQNSFNNQHTQVNQTSNNQTSNNQTSAFGNQNYESRPNLPNIAQFKPSGTSNIFSPVIDIKTSSPRNNERFADAFKKGFSQGTSYTEDKSTHAYDVNTKTGDIITTGDVSETGDINKSNNKNSNNNNDNSNNNNSNNNNTDNKGKCDYVRNPPDKDKLGLPGYSYLDPQFWDVPKRRNQVCIPQGALARGHTALEPAGYLTSGHSNVMEFHSVGSILPEFTYTEKADYVNDTNNNI